MILEELNVLTVIVVEDVNVNRTSPVEAAIAVNLGTSCFPLVNVCIYSYFSYKIVWKKLDFVR